jgi:energy-converting hydrogenase A subunit M
MVFASAHQFASLEDALHYDTEGMAPPLCRDYAENDITIANLRQFLAILTQDPTEMK